LKIEYIDYIAKIKSRFWVTIYYEF
jgi:hypothetical protein